jgi:hypothetical protein
MRTWTLLAVTLFSLLGAAARADTLRCGANVVSDGATQAEVSQKCGEPQSRSSRLEVVSQETRQGGATTGGSTATTTSVTRNIEEWTYNFGPGQFMRLVTFVNGRLSTVQSLGYGN